MHRPMVSRMLESRGVPHQVVAFDPAIRSAVDVALAAGEDPRRVLKTLVVEQDPPGARPLLVMVPAPMELDLRHLAARLGVKRLRVATHTRAEQLTGLKVGGISALALAGRRFPAVIAAEAAAFESVLVSAGERGFDVELSFADLVRLTGARVVPLADAGDYPSSSR